MLWQGPAIVGTDRLARRVDRLARRRAWAPPDGVPSLGGESREEFLQGCNGWYMSDKGQDMPCRIIEPSCQGGQSALVRFWCKEKTVPWSKLTQVVAAEGHAVGRTEKQEQNKAQLDKLQGQEASAAATAFHAECDRHYVSKAGTVTPCKMLSSKSGRSEVMFANGKASVCSAQLSWRQAPAAAKRSEQQAREQQAKKQAAVEASATVQRQKEGQRTALLEQASAVQVTEAEVSAVLHDPRYRQAGLTKGAAQQIAQMKRDSSRAHQERRQGEEQYQTALVEKGREQMEGWEQGVADGGDKVDKMRQLGLAWEAVLAPSATGKPPSAKKAAGRVRCLAEQTARAAGTTMAAAVGAVINTEVVNWQHGVQCIRERAQPSSKSLVAAVADLAEQLSTGAQCERQLGEVLCASVRRQQQAAHVAQVKAAQVAQVKDAWDKQVFHAVKVALKVKGSTEAAPTHAVGDTGAAPSLFPSNGLSVEVLKGSLRPGRAKLMHSASTHQITSKGGAALQFTLGDQDETEFRHEFQVTEGGATPAILGVDFWAAHAAKFDFTHRVIELQANGKTVKVPFTIGDEDVDERYRQCTVQRTWWCHHDRHTCSRAL